MTLQRTPTDLPIEAHRAAIGRAVADGSLVLTAEPGAGKTSVVPLVAADAVDGRVVVLQPRRLAARAAADRLAQLVGEPRPGGTIGLTMRGMRAVGPGTRIEVMTEAVLTNRLQRDPELPGVSVVVFDEFHERNLHSDLGLAMVLDVRSALRDDLSVVVMSATLDAEPVARLLSTDGPDATTIAVEGRTHPVVTIHLDRPPRQRWADAVADATTTALGDVEGDVLVFVPGRREIDDVTARLARRSVGGRSSAVDVIGLHGGGGNEARQRVLEPGEPGRRRVIVATAVAETSVTLPGIEAVVDGGLARRALFDPQSGLGRLETFNVTRFSAEQRRGRAGRLGPGRCYRLWSEAEHAHLDLAAPPEITAGDPVPLTYELIRWGDPTAQQLPLLDHPGVQRLAAGAEQLAVLGFLDETDGPSAATTATPTTLTARGRTAGELGLHPRHAALVLAAADHGPEAVEQAVAVAALLDDERHADGTDLAAEVDRRRHDLARAAGRIRSRLERSDAAIGRPDDARSTALGPLVARAWPDRIAMARTDRAGSFLTAGGREVAVEDGDPLARSPFLVVVEADGRIPTARLRRGVALGRSEAVAAGAPLVHEVDHVTWDDRSGSVRAERQRRLGAIVLHREPLIDPPADAAAAAVADGLRRRGLDLLRWRDRAVDLRARLAWLHTEDPEHWPSMDDETLLDRAADWLAQVGATSLDDVGRIDVAARLIDGLDWRQRAELDRLAPEAMAVPSGRRRPIRYDGGRPRWPVRLQELLGVDEHPTIGPRRAPLTIELLTPADRPAQVTDDLPGFWRGSYAAVRAELRGRYPKHRWPEEPWRAP